MAAAGEENLPSGVAGVIVGLVEGRDPSRRKLDFAEGQGLGVLLCLAAALSYGISALIARARDRFCRRLPPPRFN